MTAQPQDRILIVANEKVDSHELGTFVAQLPHQMEVLVVAPALIGRLQFWASDDAEARRRAEERLSDFLALLNDAGLEAAGAIGDADPLLAIEDSLRLFDADTIVISTQPNGPSNWLARDLVGRVRSRLGRDVVQLRAVAV